jgi:hypothetical protein
LVALKQDNLVEEMQEQVEANENQIRFKNRTNLNGMAAPSLALRMKRESADEYAAKLYRIYREVWGLQGKRESSGFHRAILFNAIIPALHAQSNSIISSFVRLARCTNISESVSKATIEGFRLKMRRLETRWSRHIEIEAQKCELSERLDCQQPHAAERLLANVNVPAHSGAVKPSSDVESVKTALPTPPSRRLQIINKVRNPEIHTVLTTPEAASYFEVQPRTIYRWRCEGKLKAGGRRGSITIASIRKLERTRARTPPTD